MSNITKIIAHMECDGCGKAMQFNLDPGDKRPVGWDLFDVAVDACRGGHVTNLDGFSSVQGESDQCLCPQCTNTVDALLDKNAVGDRNATDDEIKTALDEREGV